MTARIPPNTQHTPGPWQWDGHSLRPANPDPDRSAIHTILDAEHLGWGFAVANPQQITAESAANLRLIGMAPELLAALSRALPLIEAHHRTCAEGATTIILARALILAAGGQP